MGETILLADAYRATQYQVGGHGRRQVGMLKDALKAVADDTPADNYGQGLVIERFQQKIADFLGKEAAVFFPSGTMAQQIALRIWCDRAQNPRVAYHPLCHLEIHEQDGLRTLHHIEPVLLGSADRLMTMTDLAQLTDSIACLLVELPQREIGGQLPSYGELADIAAFCHDRGIRFHLDGARLYETLPYYGRSAAAIAALFDSVYVSFYKGVGGVAGAMLAGDRGFVAEAVVWKRRHGGDLISLYPYILSAEHSFDRRVGKMGQYWDEARDLAARFNAVDRVSTVPTVPVTNMFHVHIAASAALVERALSLTCQKTGVGLSGHVKALGATLASFEVNIGDQYEQIPAERLMAAFSAFADGLAQLQPEAT